MIEPLSITLKTLTPLWTGGVNGKVDRIHETGIIGSLRWWYEAIVRGLGGYVCDPTAEAEDKIGKSEFDTKAYEGAKRQGKTEKEAIQVGLQALCPVSYLFGATGWARLFRLQVLHAPMTALHFVTNLKMNEGWLKRVFGGKSQSIDNLKVPSGDIKLRLSHRGYDADYAIKQIILVLRLAAEYGGLGARLQYGFGQVAIELPPELQDVNIGNDLQKLNQRLPYCPKHGTSDPSPFNFRYFVSQTYEISKEKLKKFSITIGKPSNESTYMPCVFDLRYKGHDKWGMRRWLEDEKGWRSSDDPKRLGRLDELMGSRLQWGPRGHEKRIDDELRTAGRVFFGMPHRVQPEMYQIKVFGFAPPDLLTVEELDELCSDYMNHAFATSPISSVFGKDLLAPNGGLNQ